MRSAYYPGVCTEPGTYYQGWFMYMMYTQGQNEECSQTLVVSTPCSVPTSCNTIESTLDSKHL